MNVWRPATFFLTERINISILIFSIYSCSAIDHDAHHAHFPYPCTFFISHQSVQSKSDLISRTSSARSACGVSRIDRLASNIPLASLRTYGCINNAASLRIISRDYADLTRYFWSIFNVHKRDRRRGRWASRDTRPRRSSISFGRPMC